MRGIVFPEEQCSFSHQIDRERFMMGILVRLCVLVVLVCGVARSVLAAEAPAKAKTSKPPAQGKAADQVDCAFKTFNGEVTEGSATTFMVNVVLPCLRADKPGTILTVTSGGGNVGEALAIYDSVSTFGNRKLLTTVALGNVSSAAVLVFLSGGTRYITCNSSIFLHSIKRNLRGGGDSLDEREVEEIYQSLRGLADSYASIVAAATKVTKEQVRVMMDNGKSLNAEEAVKLGFAHEVSGCGK